MRTFARLLSALVIGLMGQVGLLVPLSAQSWPHHTVRIILPLPPGTSVDASARLFAEKLASRWGQPVIVENMPGADGILAVKEFVNRRDDHTLLYSFAGPISINPVLHATLPYDPARDLVPISMSSDNILAIAARGDLQVSSLEQLTNLARSRSTKLNWAATAGLPYYAMLALQKSANAEMVYVPYRDFGPALTDLAQGRIDIAATGLTQMLPHHQAGKIKLLAVLNKARSPLAPDIPTVAELGRSNLTFEGITGFFGWRDMPPDLRNRIAADVTAVADDPALKERLTATGILPRRSSPAEFAAAIEEQRSRVADIAASIAGKPGQ